MKKKFLHRLVAIMLAVVFTGCQAATATSPKSEAKAKRLVDTTASETYPFAIEYPAIDSDLQLPGDVLATSVQGMAVKKAPAEVTAVWISFLEMQQLLTGKSETTFRSNMKTAFKNCADFGINTVIIQVRPYADALYKSSYFPWSHIITGTEGKDPGFDPFEIMVEEARVKGLRIEAWVNPYRIRPEGNTKPLAKSNQAKKWIDEKDDSVVSYKGVISYNPASSKAQNLIVKGVVEIIENYDIDAIHIDDYFYPTTDKAFDKTAYATYTRGGGNLSLDNWRRSNVETLIKKMYKAIKEANRNVLFGISPQSSVYNNYNAHYLDVKKIASNTGYCDYICPQIYFGFENEVQPFSETLDTWDEMVTAPGVKLYVGLAVYKAGATDSWAGAGKNEWVENSDILKRMTQESRKCASYGGVGLYRYDFLFNLDSNSKSVAQKEVKNLKEVLKQS